MPKDLSSRDPRPSRMARLPSGLLGMIALIVSVESFVMIRDDDFTTFVASNWKDEAKTIARFASKNQILCFGDSMVKFGLQPRVLQPRLDKKAYNFSVYCGSAPSSYFLLRRAFEAGAKPEAIVVNFQPELLASELAVLVRVYPELLNWRETFDLSWSARDLDRFAQFAVAKVVPTVRKRFEVRASILAAFRGASNSEKQHVLVNRRNWEINKGGEAQAKNPYFTGDVPDNGPFPAMFLTPWKATDLNDLYLRRFLELAASKEVPVFWVMQPNTPAVDARREKIGYNAQYEAYARNYLAEFPNLAVIDGRHVNFPHQMFTDPVHLDGEGATACTLGVADILRSRLVDHQPGSRWIPLPDRTAEVHAFRLVTTYDSALAQQAEQQNQKQLR